MSYILVTSVQCINLLVLYTILVCKRGIALFEFVNSALAQEVLVALQPVLQ